MSDDGQREGAPADGARRSALGFAATGVAVGAVAGVVGAVMAGAAARPSAAPKVDGRKRFEGQGVLITGATSGIGRAAAIAFAREGAKVAFCGRREHLGMAVEEEIRAAGGEATYIPADVRDEIQIERFVTRGVAACGRLDVAFNNAGISIERPLHDYSAAEWDDVVQTNLRGVFLSMKHQLPKMLAAGAGVIVVTASHSTRAGAYAASKHGLMGLVRATALAYADQGIRINALVPGTTDTALVRSAAGMADAPEAVWRVAADQWAGATIPLKRLATPEEVAAFALAVASPEFPYLTGAALTLDGGVST
ncbi:MAG: SDR family oxidoreductase [Hyphomonadaceae bacterium]|nr:SDR family oxidoreductase [Hyphomonadaceae bacterium]